MKYTITLKVSVPSNLTDEDNIETIEVLADWAKKLQDRTNKSNDINGFGMQRTITGISVGKVR